jgi:homoserine O-succinyltransferase
LHERALHTSGYSILSRCRNVGPDIFVRQGRALQIYFQGHPEYRATTLLAEYRRDAARFLHGTRDSYPAAPRDYFSAAAAAEFGRIAAIARKSRDPGALAAFDALAAKQSLVNSWRGQARRIYANWLCHLQDAQAKRPTQIGFARRPASAEIAA